MVKVTNSIYNVGVNDTTIDLFEGQYNVNNKMSYNSYVIMDEKIVLLARELPIKVMVSL